MQFAKLFEVRGAQVLVQVAEDQDGLPYISYKTTVNGYFAYKFEAAASFLAAKEYVDDFNQPSAEAYYTSVLNEILDNARQSEVH